MFWKVVASAIVIKKQAYFKAQTVLTMNKTLEN